MKTLGKSHKVREKNKRVHYFLLSGCFFHFVRRHFAFEKRLLDCLGIWSDIVNFFDAGIFRFHVYSTFPLFSSVPVKPPSPNPGFGPSSKFLSFIL